MKQSRWGRERAGPGNGDCCALSRHLYGCQRRRWCTRPGMRLGSRTGSCLGTRSAFSRGILRAHEHLRPPQILYDRNAPCATMAIAQPALQALSLRLSTFMLLKVCASLSLLYLHILIRTGRGDDRAVEKLRRLQALMISPCHHVVEHPVPVYIANVRTNIAWGDVNKLHG